MRLMHWSWAEYQATPDFVIDRLIDVVNAERTDEGG